jgi:hypothetical protein
MAKTQSRKTVKAVHTTQVSSTARQTTPANELSTLPLKLFHLVLAHGITVIDKEERNSGAIRLQSLVGYFAKIAMLQLEGHHPTIAVLLEKTQTTDAGLRKAINILTDLDLIQKRYTRINNRPKAEVFFEVADRAIAAAKRSADGP